MVGVAVRRRLKALLPRRVIDQLVLIEAGVQACRDIRGRHPRDCPICGYRGLFWAKGRQPMLFDGDCPQCRSKGRHRQHHLLTERHRDWIDGATILHFTPEPCFAGRYAARAEASGGRYVRAAYAPKKGEVQVDMQAIPFPDASFDTVICHNILEHIEDDRRALRELVRVLRPDGRALISVPMYDAWEHTYEDPAITTAAGRDLHFNQHDHLRLYGRDFRDRLTQAGFDFTADVATEPAVSRYALERGETIFVATPHRA